jgi:hypothetical protein
MERNMLGALIKEIVDLRPETLGVICDLVEKLSGKAGQEWFANLRKFLRKEKCWTGFVKIISRGHLVLDAVDGTEIIPDAKDVFVHIDSDFKDWGADEPGQSTDETPVDVYEVVKDATFSQMFNDLNTDTNRLCLTQHQIKNFIKKYREWLQYEQATFFLLKSKNRFFVALVNFDSGGGLKVYAYKPECSRVWYNVNRWRIVVPQFPQYPQFHN